MVMSEKIDLLFHFDEKFLLDDKAEICTTPRARFLNDRWHKFMPHMRFRNSELPRKYSLTNQIAYILRVNSCANVTVIVGDKKYKCYLMALRAFCRLFDDPEYHVGDFLKISDSSITPECFEIAYSWMTRDEIYCYSDEILDLLVAAKSLICPRLTRTIYDCLNDHNNYSELEAFNCYGQAMAKGMTDVAMLMLGRVGKSFLILVGSDEFSELSAEHCSILLGSDYLAVQSEIETFYAALNWIYNNYEERKNDIGLILDSVKFSWMPPLFLLCWADFLPDLQSEMAEQLGGFVDAAMALQQCETLTPFIRHGESEGSRNWVRDPKCRYEKHLYLGYPHKVSVESFHEYIHSNRVNPSKFRARLEESAKPTWRSSEPSLVTIDEEKESEDMISVRQKVERKLSTILKKSWEDLKISDTSLSQFMPTEFSSLADLEKTWLNIIQKRGKDNLYGYERPEGFKNIPSKKRPRF